MSTQQKWLAAIAVAVVAFFAVWGINVVIDLPDIGDNDFTLSAEAFVDSVVLSWEDPPDGVEDFMALRSGVGELGTFSKMDSVAPSESRVVDRNVNAGETWFYVVRARRLDSLTNIVEVTIPGDTLTEPPDTTELPDTVSPDTSDQVGGPLPGDIERPTPVAGWPDNEPVGYTPVAFFDGEAWGGFQFFGQGWNDTTRVVTVPDQDAKYGVALEKRTHVGDGSGWNQALAVSAHHVVKSVYVRVVMQLSANWDYHHSGDKWWIGPDRGQNGVIMTSFYARNGTFFVGGHPAGAPPSTQARIILPGSPPFTGGAPFGNGPFATATRGQYHTIELTKTVQDPGQANGSLRVWIDGVEHTRFSLWGGGEEWADVTLSSVEWVSSYQVPITGISTRFEIPLFWGGQDDIKKVNDYVRLAEVYVSARN